MRNRRESFLAVCLLCLLFCGCDHIGAGGSSASPSRRATLWVVLLDRSVSVKADTSIYDDAVRRLTKAVQPGDRFVMGAITATSGTDFRLSVDESLPDAMPSQGMMDEPKQYEKEKASRDAQIRDAKDRIDKGVQRFLHADTTAAKSAIFESLFVVAPLIEADQRKHVLVILSDMLEDSSAADFERQLPTDASTKRLIERQEKDHTIPNLAGVAVCVAGAVASPPERAAAVERFWRSYLEKAGATIAPGSYARTLTGCI